LFSEPLGSGSTSNVSTASDSSGFVGDLVSDYESHYGAVAVNELPILVVPSSQPLVPVATAAGCNGFQSDTGSEIPIPVSASTQDTSDHPLVIDQPSTGSEWELWRASDSSSGWSACWGGKLDTSSSDGVFPSPFGLSASGISYLATTVTNADVASGRIDHVLAVDLPACNAPAVAPADRTDCSSDPGQPSEGQWFRLPASVSMPSGLTPFAQMVFRALQTYGMVVTDQSGAVAIQAEEPWDWALDGNSGPAPLTASFDGLPEYEVLNGIPWNQLQVVTP
jgi:hypothetical protein